MSDIEIYVAKKLMCYDKNIECAGGIPDNENKFFDDMPEVAREIYINNAKRLLGSHTKSHER